MGRTAHEPSAVCTPLDSGAPTGAAPDADWAQSEMPARHTKRHAATMAGVARRDHRRLTN
jgi:hypothetical protein